MDSKEHGSSNTPLNNRCEMLHSQCFSVFLIVSNMALQYSQDRWCLFCSWLRWISNTNANNKTLNDVVLLSWISFWSASKLLNALPFVWLHVMSKTAIYNENIFKYHSLQSFDFFALYPHKPVFTRLNAFHTPHFTLYNAIKKEGLFGLKSEVVNGAVF